MSDNVGPAEPIGADPWSLEQQFERVLGASGDVTDGAEPELSALTAALRGPASGAELAGLDAALTYFHQAGPGTPDVSTSPIRRLRRSAVLSTLLASKLVVASAASAVALTGVAAAAYTNALPNSLQNFAHSTIGAPAPDGTNSSDSTDSTDSADPTATASDSATPQGPDATGPAAFGLCTAYLHGGLAAGSVAYQNLAAAALGIASASASASATDTTSPTVSPSTISADAAIRAYCGTVPHPGSSNRPSHSPSHATGKPSDLPTSHSGNGARPSVTPPVPTGFPTHP